jgi:two-component system, OmpR family, phosphate regulon sensor histidine kinase PhoR
MIKNITPSQLVLYSSSAISLVIGLLAVIAVFCKIVIVNWYFLLIFPALVFLCTYLIMYSALKQYIYRKIKLIYKSIHSSKRPSNEKPQINMNEDIMGDIEQEVAGWVDSRKKEIESLKSMEQYRRNFMGDISHELKTPIFSIQGYLHTLLDGALYDEKINEDYIRKAAKNVDRLETIVEDLEAISKLETGELILDFRPFDIKTLCEDVFEELEIMAKKNKISLFFKEGASNSFQVKADQSSIRQVLVNLIANSIKYGKEGGHTKVSFYDMDQLILVEVADDGIGIGAEHLKHLFDRFYRVDKSRSRGQGGSGLGLSIVKHIIEAHKQTINVRSTEGVGSTFGFTLNKAV